MNESLEDQLLRASLLCGLAEAGSYAYRLQLFFVANRDLGSKSKQSDFQRALETGVAPKGLWVNYGEKGGGEYALTPQGLAAAAERFEPASARYGPMSKAKFRCTLQGVVGSTQVRIQTTGADARVSVDGLPAKSAVEACKRIAARTGIKLDPTGTSAVRLLYDLGIDHGFDIKLG